MSDFTKASKALLLDLVNTSGITNGKVLTEGLVDIGLPIETTGTNPPKNTTITFTAKEGSGYTGAVTVQYNRPNLAEHTKWADGTDMELVFTVGNAVNIADMLPEINAQLLTNIDPSEIVDGPLPTFTGELNEEHAVQLVADADSLAYRGSLTFILKAEDIDLATVITNQTLDGLTVVPRAKPVTP
jgi:hypothetical protein